MSFLYSVHTRGEMRKKTHRGDETVPYHAVPLVSFPTAVTARQQVVAGDGWFRLFFVVFQLPQRESKGKKGKDRNGTVRAT